MFRWQRIRKLTSKKWCLNGTMKKELGDETYEKKGVHNNRGMGLLETSRDQTVIIVGFG